MPPAYNHPARTAERIATLDIVSNGRVDFGTGESSSEMELGGFGIDREAKKEQWEEALRCTVGMFRDEPWEFHGKYVNFENNSGNGTRPHVDFWATVAQAYFRSTDPAAYLGGLEFASAPKPIDGFWAKPA